MRIKNLDKIIIDQNEKRGVRPAKTYLGMTIRQLKELEIETPIELFQRCMNLLKDFKAENVIIVSHECTLEAFMLGQKGYSIKQKSYKKYFDYGDFAILN